jgi:hypothetical protein
LHECVGACLLRREACKPGWRNLNPEAYVWLAAQSMLGDPELEVFVPRRLRAEILEEQRLEEERHIRAEKRARAERKAAERRAREAEERAEHARVLTECYWRTRYVYLVRWTLAHPDLVWAGHDEAFNREWPKDRPRWWLPPPQLYDAMRSFLRHRDATRNSNLDFPTEVPGWEEWLPPYVPGKPWPWRKPEADADGAAA